MRASRLLSILLTLSVRGKVSAAELARDLEVSVRTVYRDIEALSAAGVPVYATQGRGGGIHLLEGYRTRLTGLTAEEADAMFLSGLPGAAAELGLGGVLATSQLKLLAALPPELRERAARIRDRFHLDAPGWLRDTDTPPALAAVADAAWSDRRLDVRYQRSNRSVVERVLDPLGLVLKAGTWYLVAGVADDGRGPRTYRVSRILTALVRDDAVQRPAGFELEAFWSDYQRSYAERIYTATAEVRLSPTGLELLFLVGTIPARRARMQLREADADGWVRTEVPVESLRHGLHALLQLGQHVEVIGPAELRQLIARSARALAACYDSVPGLDVEIGGGASAADSAVAAGSTAAAAGRTAGADPVPGKFSRT